MKRIIILIIGFFFLNVNAFSQKINERNLTEYTCIIKEVKKGECVIIPNYDYLGVEFWKENILSSKPIPTQSAIEKLNRFGFLIKSTTTIDDGLLIITMAKKEEKRFSNNNFRKMLEIASELDKQNNIGNDGKTN